jgi:hypothetical protein
MAGHKADFRRDTTMMRHDLRHDVEVVGRGGATALIGFVLVAFVALAAGTTVYDIGKWLGAW